MRQTGGCEQNAGRTKQPLSVVAASGGKEGGALAGTAEAAGGAATTYGEMSGCSVFPDAMLRHREEKIGQTNERWLSAERRPAAE
jgi:hypothetical protein